MNEAPFTIKPARSRDDLLSAAELFREYADSLPIKLDYQGFEAELACLPGKYAPPTGEILLASNLEGQLVGCVAVRPFAMEGCCEMKRLYVQPNARGLGLGRVLRDETVEIARQMGYHKMLLDTLDSMLDAIALYSKGGFQVIPAYYDTPIENTVFMSLEL